MSTMANEWRDGQQPYSAAMIDINKTIFILHVPPGGVRHEITVINRSDFDAEWQFWINRDFNVLRNFLQRKAFQDQLSLQSCLLANT